MGLLPASSPLAHPTLMALQRPRHLLGAPVWMRMRNLDELRTPSDGLWSSMGLDQSLELIEIMRRYEERTLRVLTRHRAPPREERPSLRTSHALSRTGRTTLSIPGGRFLFFLPCQQKALRIYGSLYLAKSSYCRSPVTQLTRLLSHWQVRIFYPPSRISTFRHTLISISTSSIDRQSRIIEVEALSRGVNNADNHSTRA